MPAKICTCRECKGLIIKGKEERAWGVEKGEPSAVSVILDITVIYGGKGLENIVAILTERAILVRGPLLPRFYH